jgi:hypothetical protein
VKVAKPCKMRIVFQQPRKADVLVKRSPIIAA